MEERVCASCGNKLGEGQVFCTNCGAKYGEAPRVVNNDLKYEVKGGNLPFLKLFLSKGQSVICEAGSMSWRTDKIEMDTTSNGGAGKVFSRLFSGERLFQNKYTSLDDNQELTFASSFPGDILSFDIDENHEIICQKTAFLAATEGVELSIHFNKKIGVGLFGGEGFIMQRMSGKGKAFIEVDGSIEERVLKPGEKFVVSTGHLVMMDKTCQIDVETVKGLKNIFLGGQGIFNTIITGPGRVVMQSMPISKTANSMAAYLPLNNSSSSSSSSNSTVGEIGNVVKMFRK